MLKKTKYMLVPYLGAIFRGMFMHRVYSERWKTFKTVVIRKPGHDDYSNPNSYQPIALLDTVAKVLSSCMKTKLAHHMEKVDTLLKLQFSGRLGRSTTDLDLCPDHIHQGCIEVRKGGCCSVHGHKGSVPKHSAEDTC